jgi:PhnB protein
MQLNPHLSFNGHCEAAFRFYEKFLGGNITVMMTYGESPAAGQVPAGWRQKIIHATLTLGSQRLTGADTLPDHYQRPQGLSVLLNITDAPEAERIFHTLAENGTVQMALQETFWAQRFGMLVDQFGTPWMINCGRG